MIQLLKPVAEIGLDDKGRIKSTKGKAVKEKFYLITDSTIRFKTKQDAFNYLIENCIMDNEVTFENWNKYHYKKYIAKVLK